MPSALETLMKILKLEREQGYKNTAVIGGLGAFTDRWQSDAHAQAKRPEHHALVDELAGLMRRYEQLTSHDERHEAVKYMIGRITGRIPPADTPAPPGPAATPAPVREQPPARSAPRPPAQQERIAEPRRERPRPPAPAVESPHQATPTPPPAQGPSPAEAMPPVGAGPVEAEAAPLEAVEPETVALEMIAPEEPAAPAEAGMEEAGQPVEPSRPKPRRRPRRPRELAEELDLLRGLEAPVTVIEGVGEKNAEKLAQLGIRTVGDLLYHVPRRHDDYTRLLPINRARPGEVVTLIGTIVNSRVFKGRSGRQSLQIVMDDGTATLTVFFFGQPYLQDQLKRGEQVVVSGRVEQYLGRPSMNNPEWELLEFDNLHTRAIVPVYPLTKGLPARTLRRIMKSTVDYWAPRLPDYLPESVLDRAELVDLGWALRQLHFPEHWDYLRYARERLAFDELFLLQTAMLTRRRAWQKEPGVPQPVTDSWLAGVLANLPFPLTAAQERAVAEIRADMARAVPMNRLLQGDVGSGKTIVAVLAMLMAVENGGQAALMAPTGILAEQHFRAITRALATLMPEREIAVRLLTGATPPAERSDTLARLAAGTVSIVIGTHALIQPDVDFANLTLAIIDEQHRFGVAQRGLLRGKGANPHLLVMTATPIPRTLALTIHADLDLTVIDELPPGRTPVETHLLTELERERAYSFIDQQIDRGRQAFIIYPLVEAEDTEDESRAAVDEYERLSHEIFPRRRLGLLHGRMSADDKDAVMARFQAGELDILVSTAVVEVGIDVPNASVILIEGANRFGLAQLHQFRGRVGRGPHPSYCLLISDADGDTARARLEAMVRTTDGFELAEIDYRLRGAGDLLGTRQSGYALRFRFAEGFSPELVALAQREARALHAEDPDLSLPEHRLLAERIAMWQAATTDLS
ncbi:MAG: ATP-dependent DNA helicase RecG [Anaerolineae bacterium]|nr:ATP-dependent DNA helicase RecG [Anaerolineae bacterium]